MFIEYCYLPLHGRAMPWPLIPSPTIILLLKLNNNKNIKSKTKSNFYFASPWLVTQKWSLMRKCFPWHDVVIATLLMLIQQRQILACIYIDRRPWSLQTRVPNEGPFHNFRSKLLECFSNTEYILIIAVLKCVQVLIITKRAAQNAIQMWSFDAIWRLWVQVHMGLKNRRSLLKHIHSAVKTELCYLCIVSISSVNYKQMKGNNSKYLAL